MTPMRLDQKGFSLIEILVALAILAVIIVGALGVVGTVNVGGLVETLPTGFGTVRVAKDYTVATIFLQGLSEYIADATRTGSALDCDGTVPPCTLTRSPGDGRPSPFGYSAWPPSAPDYQLDWSGLSIELDIWNWNGTEYRASVAAEACDGTPYASGSSVTSDKLYMVRSILVWSIKGAPRRICVERFVPYRPSIQMPSP